MGHQFGLLFAGSLTLVSGWAGAYSVRRSFASAEQPGPLQVLQPDLHSTFPRFALAKSKLDLMVFITNVFFPSQDPPEYKAKFKRGGCPRWLLDPRREPQELANDWLPAPGWAYDLPNQVISYSGSEEAKEPAHAFPFNLFLPRRPSSRFALVKRDFFCQGTQIQSTIMLDGAKEAGLLFRGVGERNFWAVLLALRGRINIVRVKNGERLNLGTVGNLVVQGGQWYTVNVQEQIGDVVVTASREGEEHMRSTRKQEAEEEARPKGYEESQGAAGLIASGGPAKFKGTFVGDVNWVPEVTFPHVSPKLEAVTSALGKDLAVIFDLPADLKNWCPEGSLCAESPLY